MNIETLDMPEDTLARARQVMNGYDSVYLRQTAATARAMGKQVDALSKLDADYRRIQIDLIHGSNIRSFCLNYALLLEAFDDLNGVALAQFGSNVGVYLEFLAGEGADVVGIEADWGILAFAHGKTDIPMEHGDARKIEQHHWGIHDAVLAHHFIDDMYFERKDISPVLAQAHLALKPTGVLIASMSNIPQRDIMGSPFSRVVQYNISAVGAGENYVFFK